MVDFIRGLSLRHKLLALVLGPLLLLTGTVILLTARWSTSYTYQQLFTKVNTDLRVTQDIFDRIQFDRQRALTSLANSSAFSAHLQNDYAYGVVHLLNRQKEHGGFDFVNLLSNDGTQRLTDKGWVNWNLNRSPLTESVFSDWATQAPLDTATGIEIYSKLTWSFESESLAQKVVFPLIDTPRAAPTDKTVEDRAMVIRVLQRVRGSDGIALGVLEGGLLLNRNYAFVDEIRDLVYGPGSLAAGSRGTVTVFLDDVRITTNVPSSDDTRALGTRVSVEVRNSVLEQGLTWVDRAFVVNDWYISAYQPIVDVYGDRVGMLYAGYLEAPFRRDLNRGIALIAAVVLAGSMLAVVAAILGAKSIFKPVESIARVVRATAAGEHQRIGKLNVRDEIGELATQFDSMLDTMAKNSAQIKANANELEHKVQERTTELKLKNTSLQESITMLHEAQQKLATAERLAAVGQLKDVQTEIDLIIEQVYRIRSITDRLLQYSRPTTTAPLKQDELLGLPALSSSTQHSDTSPVLVEMVEVNELIDSSLVLVKQEVSQKHIDLLTRFEKVPRITIDKLGLQQVIVNLVLNASQAVSDQGQVVVSTFLCGDNMVCIEVKDNGVGIASEHLPRLFDPFFTFGKEGGTGLGLSVSYGIVQRYGGAIDVASEPGEGTTFTISLPIRESNALVEHHASEHVDYEMSPG